MINRRGRRATTATRQRVGTPGDDDGTAGRGRRRGGPASLLRGHLDAPAADEEMTGDVHVAGWAFHPEREVRGVVVAIDGLVVGGTTVLVERPDVAAHLALDAAQVLGWATTVALPDTAGTDLRLDAYAVLAPRGEQDDDSARLGQPVLLESVSLSVRRPDPRSLGGGPAGMDRPSARILAPQELTMGYNRVLGLADVPGEVSRVEVTHDGVATGPARTAMPGHSHRADRQPSAQVALFEAGVVVTTPGEVELGGTVECVDGSHVTITPLTLEVVEASTSGPSPERIDAVRRRAADRFQDVSAGPSATTSPATSPVLVLTHDLGLGGGQLWLHELVLRLSARGVPMVLASPRGGVLVEEMEDLGIPVLVTGTLDAHSAEGYEAHVLLVTQWAREHGCRSAIANTMSAFAGVDAAQRLGLPVAWAIHESFPLDQFWVEAFPPPLPAYAAERGRVALGLADRAVFEAGATLDLYAPHLGADVGDVVPYGVDFSDIDRYVQETDRAALRERLGLSESTLVLLCIGTIEPRKAQINLAQAFLGSERLRDLDATLVLVGSRAGSPYVDALEAYVESMGGVDRVRIEPVQPDTYQWYHVADVLLCASDVESLPRSMLEAMAFATPVASTSVFGIPELITDGVTGLLCEPRDLSVLRDLLERTVATPRAELRSMGARARELVLRRHDPAVYEQYFVDWLETTTEGTP